MNRSALKRTNQAKSLSTTTTTKKYQHHKRSLTTSTKKILHKPKTTSQALLQQARREMAAQPAVRKAFQTTGVTQAVAPNPNTSKSQFRLELYNHYSRAGYVLVKHVLTPANIRVMDNDFAAIFRGKYPGVKGLSPNPSTLTDEELNNFSGIEHPLKVAAAARNLVFNNPQIRLGLRALIGSKNIKCVSSDYWIQGPGEYGRAWGQDEETIMTRDKSLVMAFIALDDLSSSEGTILVHPGSHKSGILFPPTRSPYDQDNASGSETSYDWQSLVKRQSGDGPKLIPFAKNDLDESDASETAQPYPINTSSTTATTNTTTNTNQTNPTKNTSATLSSPKDEVDSIASVPVDMPAGSVLFVNGYTLQRMMMGMSESIHRRLLRVHFTSAETPVSWNTSAGESHLFAQHLDGLSYEEMLDVRDIMMVSGNDPYEYKGTRNIFPVELVRRRGVTM